jgi:hypothetical protein
MKFFLLIAVSVLSASISFAQEKVAKEWANQALCNIEVSYHDLTSDDFSRTVELKRSVLIDLELDPESLTAYKQVMVDLPEIQSTVQISTLFENYKDVGIPSEEKSLTVSSAVTIEGHSYGAVMNTKNGNSNQSLIITNYSLRTKEDAELQKYYDTVGKEQKLTTMQMLKALYPDKQRAYRDVQVMCSASPTARIAVTPKF